MIDTLSLIQDKQALQRKIELSEAVYRLEQHPDFVSIFKMQYFTNEALQAVRDLATCEAGSDDHTALLRKLQSLSDVQHYLDNLKQHGAMAKEELKELNAIPLESEYTNE